MDPQCVRISELFGTKHLFWFAFYAPEMLVPKVSCLSLSDLIPFPNEVRWQPASSSFSYSFQIFSSILLLIDISSSFWTSVLTKKRLPASTCLFLGSHQNHASGECMGRYSFGSPSVSRWKSSILWQPPPPRQGRKRIAGTDDPYDGWSLRGAWV